MALTAATGGQVIDRLQGAGENFTEAGFEFNALLPKTDLGITT